MIKLVSQCYLNLQGLNRSVCGIHSAQPCVADRPCGSNIYMGAFANSFGMRDSNLTCSGSFQAMRRMQLGQGNVGFQMLAKMGFDELEGREGAPT